MRETGKLYLIDGCKYCSNALKALRKTEMLIDVIYAYEIDGILRNKENANLIPYKIDIFPFLVVNNDIFIYGEDVVQYLKTGFITDMNNKLCPLNRMKVCDVKECAFAVNIKGKTPRRTCGYRLSILSSITSIGVNEEPKVNKDEDCCS